MLTKRNKNAIIKKYQADSKDKTKNRRISNEITNKKEEKAEITSFLFCSKKSKKVFLKNVEKVLTKKKRYSIIQNVPRRKTRNKKYIEK